jgi:transitional endoplasmic reticulum ATPase
MKSPDMNPDSTEAPGLKLKVTEAFSKDVGRAIARMGPGDLETLQLAVGDMVEVTGKRGTVCKAMPAQGTPRAIPNPDRRVGA